MTSTKKMKAANDAMPASDDEVVASVQTLLQGVVSHMNTLLSRNLVLNFQIGQKDNNPEGMFQLNGLMTTRRYKV